MFLSRNKKNNVYPCKPQFYYIKVGFKGSKLYRHVFMMDVCKVSVLKKRFIISASKTISCGVLIGTTSNHLIEVVPTNSHKL